MGRNLHWKESDLKNQISDSKPQKLSKYRNTKVEFDGMVFDSKKECDYYKLLLIRKQAGELVKIECQYPMKYSVMYYLTDVFGNGINKDFGKTYKYIADFKITYPDGHFEIIDVKGYRTKEYKQKKRIIEKLYGVKIIEV